MAGQVIVTYGLTRIAFIINFGWRSIAKIPGKSCGFGNGFAGSLVRVVDIRKCSRHTDTEINTGRNPDFGCCAFFHYHNTRNLTSGKCNRIGCECKDKGIDGGSIKVIYR